MAWVVAKQPLGASIIWLLFGANVCWTIGYDTLYAMADKADDQVLGVHSFAITLGDYDFLGVVLCYAACFGCWLLLLKHLMPTGWAWLPTLLAIVEAVHLLWRANDRQPRHCFQAFLVNQRLGLWLWLTLVLHFMS